MISRTSIIFDRLPDTGPLDIKDYKEFLEQSKTVFENRWSKVITYDNALEQFDPIRTLGTGSFGNVLLVKYRINNRFYAMKTIVKEVIVKSKQVEYLKNEKKVLQCTNFPFLLYLHCCLKDNCFVYLLMPYVPIELFDLLNQFNKFNESHARFYVCQVVLAVEYIHYLDLIYRDLKPENILIDSTGYIKLTDFGFCKPMISKRTFTLCGTPEYIAPEVLLNKGYNFAVDWWGCGVLMYEMVAGTTPFHGRTAFKTCSNVISGRYKMPRHFSLELKDLIENILTSDLTKRFGNLKHGADEIKYHKWFRTVNWMAVLNRTLSAPYVPKSQPTGHVREKLVLPVASVADKYADLFNEF